MKKTIEALKKKFAAPLSVFFSDKSINLQYALGLMTLVLSLLIGIKLPYLIVIVVLIGMVISVEVLNTCIEQLLDLYTQKYHLQVKRIKDLAALAVLIMAICSAVVFVMIIGIHYGILQIN